MANATDRDDLHIGGSLMRAPSHQRRLSAELPLEPVLSHQTQRSHFEPLALELIPSHHSHVSRHSLHAHFEPEPSSSVEDISQGLREVVDIEHAAVDDDPREWSKRKKNFVLGLITVAVLGPMISPSIYNPVLDEVQRDLHASETEIALSLSLYILFQGVIPVAWVTLAEIVGRKPVYVTSFILYTVGSVAGSRARSMPILIGMRILQAVGSSAVTASGAGSLADMYEVKERGRKLGLFYGMPMLGPTLGPLIGGALGNSYGWRSTLYFLASFAGIMTIAFLFFPDTWRRERSRVYQKAMADALKRQLKARAAEEKREAKRERKRLKGLASTATTPAATTPGTPTGAMTPAESDLVDIEHAAPKSEPTFLGRLIHRFRRSPSDELHPSFVDLNPFPSMISVFHSPTNATVLLASGLLFAVQYTTTYTASVTFARAPYNYNPLIIGVVLLSFGMGNVVGSVVGGRWSDYALRRMTAKNGGKPEPEMRLRCTIPAMPLLLAAYLVYAWTADQKTMIAGPVVGLFFAGFSLLFVYSSTLAYLVDSNPGRASSAVACNSFMRGAVACVMSQVAMPIQNAIGDGGLYTLFTGVVAISCGTMVLVAYRGGEWREAAAKRSSARKAERASAAGSAMDSAMGTGAHTPYGRSEKGTGANTPRV